MARPAFGRTFATNRSVNSRLWHLLVNVVAASRFVSEERRAMLYRRCGVAVGSAAIRPGCWLFSANVEFGDDVWIGDDITFDSRDRITIQARAVLSPECALVTSGHLLGSRRRRAGDYRGAPIVVGEGAWIGFRATILQGVTIGPGAVVGAGAVVTRDCPADTFVAGVPAKVVRTLPEDGAANAWSMPNQGQDASIVNGEADRRRR